MRSETFEVRSGERLVTDVTDVVADFVSGEGDGLINIFVPHATAGIALIETGSGSEADLATVIDRVAPAEDIYRHRHGSTGHGRDHVLPAFIAPSVTVPVIDGRLALGTWQSVVLVDPNVDNKTRTIRLTFQ
ncbi:MAG TPA: secondary thiamine-phosphate synthase enzyme YjbQ [Mycobacteriales bacterium]|nr:secondary thiamine-phosphate synthase enzyme YjbQ [Mycobacteriales bacterium]